MSNAKIIQLIAEANLQLADELKQLVSLSAQQMAQTRADLEQLQQAIAPMAADLAALRAELDRLSRERG